MTRPDNTGFLRAAHEKRRTNMLQRTLQTVQRMAAEAELISYTGLAAAAGVSRAWLYHQPEVREAIEVARAEVRAKRRGARSGGASDASNQARMRLLLEDNQALRAEVTALKAKLAELLGEIRELKQVNGRP